MLDADLVGDGVGEAVDPGDAVGVGAGESGEAEGGAFDGDGGVAAGQVDDGLGGFGGEAAGLCDDGGVEGQERLVGHVSLPCRRGR